MCNYSEGVINKGLAKGIAQGIIQGRAEGIIQGRAEGKAEGRAEGRAEGKAEGRADVLKALRELGVDEETIQKAAAKAG